MYNTSLPPIIQGPYFHTVYYRDQYAWLQFPIPKTPCLIPAPHRSVWVVISRKRFYHLPTIQRAAKTDKHSSKIVNMPAKIAQLAFLSLAAAILRSRRFLEASAPASVSKSRSHHLKLLA